MNIILEVLGYVSPKRRKQLISLVFFMLLAALAEFVSIGAALPFLAAMSDPELLLKNETLSSVLFEIGVNKDNIRLRVTVAFIILVVIASLLRISMTWIQTRISFEMGAEFGCMIYKKTLNQAYAVHKARNSSELIAGISKKSESIVHGLIYPVLQIISSSLILLIIYVGLIMISPIVAITVAIAFGIIYSILIKTAKGKLIEEGKIISEEANKYIKALQEGLTGIREIILDNKQKIFMEIFRGPFLRYQRANANFLIISIAPRYGVEGIGIIVIACVAYLNRDEQAIIPLLGTIAIGAQRMLPLLQQLYNSISSMRGYRQNVIDTIELLKQPYDEQENRGKISINNFNHCIQIKNLSYYYPRANKVTLNKINLNIKRGERLGIAGRSGSGKSTLVDLITGLIETEQGEILIDEININDANVPTWQRKISHVPQNTFILDASVNENIAFEFQKEKIDYKRVREAAKIAQIDDYIMSLDSGYDTILGENGANISGGQRQRIAIARAVYKDPEILILDEATSALDQATERCIMRSLFDYNKNLTIIIVAHRLSTLEECNKFLIIENNKLISYSNYDKFLKAVEENDMNKKQHDISNTVLPR
jgi:ABC-type bacteriocin/lantibiotic exporter with double-glycine peptidase domain